MYEQHWQLAKKPFENDTDPAFLYPSEAHQGALLKLRYAVENRLDGAALAGAAGTGKTLLFSILQELSGEKIGPWAHLVFPQMAPEGLLRWLAAEFAGGNSPAPSSVEDNLRLIETALRKNNEQGRHAVVAIDEAHLLEETGALETTRLLLNLKEQGKPLMTLVLLGQPRLLTCLERTPGLEQRMGVKCVLRPLNLEESLSYIQHRLKAAEAQRDVFEEKAMEAVHFAAGGIPRHINRICDLALLIGFAEQQEVVTEQQIEAVAGELQQVEID